MNFFKKISPKVVAFLIIAYLSLTLIGCHPTPSTKTAEFTEETTEIKTEEEKELTIEEVLQKWKKSDEIKKIDKVEIIRLFYKDDKENILVDAAEKAIQELFEEFFKEYLEYSVVAAQIQASGLSEECKACLRQLLLEETTKPKIWIYTPEIPELEEVFDNKFKELYPDILNSLIEKEYDCEIWESTNYIFIQKPKF